MKPPLYVDLDGTLIRADTMQQASLLLLRDHPFQAIRAALALRNGRQAAKDIAAKYVMLDPENLPYREVVIDYAKAAKAEGRRVVLATGTHRRYADAVAKYLGIFDDVFATEHGTNLIGKNKLDAIRADCGNSDFEYLGDSHADIVIWEASSVAGIVGGRHFDPFTNLNLTSHRLAHIHNNRPGDILRLIRPHQWVKNLLVMLPLLASHRVTEWMLICNSLLTFVYFSLIASGNYIINDLFDSESDRKHLTKRNRPIACGSVGVPRALLVAAFLLTTGLLGAALLSLKLFVVMISYLILANLYSLSLKRKLLVDVIALAGMYTIRPIAGGEAIDITPSTWLLAFCMFFFACIAFVKRYVELRQQIDSDPKTSLPGRGYQTADLDIIRTVGPVNGYLAVMVIALYISNPDVTKLYHSPTILWLICPVLVYWVTRIWFLAHRGVLHDDPVVFALQDGKTWAVLLISILIGVAASIF